MCGLFGVVRFSGVTDADQRIFRQLSTHLKHRGPDGSGAITTQQMLLGMHRLSIMDVSGGWQPFWSQDESVGVLGNGEIYNAKTLREGLLREGRRLGTNSDMEVVPHLYQDLGGDAYGRLRGMFALVILDKTRARLSLVRDRLGEKPLSYSIGDGVIYFSSEQSPLVRSGAVALDLDEKVLADYLLHGFVPEPNSIIRGVHKVPAGCSLEIDLRTGEVEIHPYWAILDALGDGILNTDQLSAGIQNAVEACCESDVPVGIALSGGLDSSMVAAMAHRVRPDLQAFSIGYHGTASDESTLATELAEHLGIPCRVLHLDSRDVGSGFAEVCTSRDEPLSDIAGPSLAAVSRLARECGVPVLMTGLGGDELFWGYDWVRRLAGHTYSSLTNSDADRREHRLESRLPALSPAGLARWLDSWGGYRTVRDISSFNDRWGTEASVPLPLFEFQFGYRSINRSISELCGLDGPYPKPSNFAGRDPSSIAGAYMKIISETYQRVNGLAQMDRLSMNYSVETRAPLVDYRLVELVMSTRRAGDGGLSKPSKSELRKVAVGLLPPEVVNRPKRGFTPPVRDWIREIWRQNPESLSENSILVQGGFMNSDRVLQELKTPIRRSGRVNQISLRLATLEFWLGSFRR